jgi:hypothetical protein
LGGETNSGGKPMKLKLTCMTAGELSLVLNISEETVKKLEKTQQIPSFSINKRKYFDFGRVFNHLKALEEGGKAC